MLTITKLSAYIEERVLQVTYFLDERCFLHLASLQHGPELHLGQLRDLFNHVHDFFVHDQRQDHTDDDEY